jgi:hypothetical protein
MNRHERDYKFLFGVEEELNRDFKVRNHVDVLVGLAISKFERTATLLDRQEKLWARLLRKFKYKDSRTPMGLWLYKLQAVRSRLPRMADCEFEEFPGSITASRVEATAAEEIDFFDFGDP